MIKKTYIVQTRWICDSGHLHTTPDKAKTCNGRIADGFNPTCYKKYSESEQIHWWWRIFEGELQKDIAAEYGIKPTGVYSRKEKVIERAIRNAWISGGRSGGPDYGKFNQFTSFVRSDKKREAIVVHEYEKRIERENALSLMFILADLVESQKPSAEVNHVSRIRQ